ncbi:MAG: cysteine desulfurase [Candidatus Latescibacteria bacterium]|nr:cysteine desulfurase [Candidatus Latescibacterota bacterium]
MKPIYLDYNATTPHDPEVVAAMRPYLETHFGNPSSAHEYGHQTRAAVVVAREQVASLLGCQPEEVVFTSGGTEANNHALKGLALARRSRGNHLITTQIEHPAITEVCAFLQEQGFTVSYVPVDETGLVNVADIEKAITPQTILISVMHANNEVGTIQPIAQIAKLAQACGVVLHTDAAQSAGKIPVEVDRLGVDLLSLAGHKLYAPKGVGALYVRQGLQLGKFMHGAGHERGSRAGTENVLGIVGLGKACEIAHRDLKKNTAHLKAMRDRLYAGLQEKAGEVRVNGHPEHCLPNTLSLSFRGVGVSALLSRLATQVAASAGAACHAEGVELSHVLKAMQVPLEWARGTVRFSTGRMTTAGEIDEAVETIAACLHGQ